VGGAIKYVEASVRTDQEIRLSRIEAERGPDLQEAWPQGNIA